MLLATGFHPRGEWIGLDEPSEKPVSSCKYSLSTGASFGAHSVLETPFSSLITYSSHPTLLATAYVHTHRRYCHNLDAMFSFLFVHSCSSPCGIAMRRGPLEVLMTEVVTRKEIMGIAI